MKKAFLFATLVALMGGRATVSARVLPQIGNPKFQSYIVMKHGSIYQPCFKVDGKTVSIEDSKPYFEFCVNGEIVSSLSPIWKFGGMDRRNLPNGGVIHTYKFIASGRLKGLTVLIDRECFHSDVLVRERMRLHSSKPGLKLTNIDGKNHFIFPQYSFESTKDVSADEIKIGRFETKTNLKSNHMFHPDRNHISLGETPSEVKGPFLITELDGGHKVMVSYEHASQDNTFMNERNVKKDNRNDAMQGVEGNQGIITDDDLWFIAIGAICSPDGKTRIYNRIRRGGYIDGEEIPQDGYYETVWSAISIMDTDANTSDAIQKYIHRQITDHKASRKAVFYYNTWGMQRDMPKDQLRSCMTEERLARDIMRCKEMGIDRFILDDGWQASMGYWTADPKKFPNGLSHVVKMINDAGMEAGVWLSLLAVAKGSPLYEAHPEWRINDKYGAPLLVQWGNPGFDIVSGFYDVLLDALKNLVDQGVRFFKWDAVSTMSSSNAGLGHGDEDASSKERIDRYNYLFPFYVTRLARELKEYNPDVVVELDLTEHWRCMIGLMTLQESKFFWINNGASRYGDYSVFRTKSVRAGMNEFAGIFPPEVFTFATYPMNLEGALEYNVNSVLMGGHGFWGNLDKTTSEDRRFVASQLRKAKKVLPHTEGWPMTCSGALCSSPEIYSQINKDNGYALVTAFSSERWKGDYNLSIDPDKVMAVLGNPYTLTESGVSLSMDLQGNDDSSASFILGRDTESPRIISSSCPLEDVTVNGRTMDVKSCHDGKITVQTAQDIISEYDVHEGQDLTIRF